MGVIDVIVGAKSGRSIASRLSALPAETEMAGLGCFPNGVPFYLCQTMTLISRDGGELTSNYIIYSLGKNSSWPKQIVPLADFDTWLASRKTPVYLIVRQSDTNKLATIAMTRKVTIQPLGSGYWGAQLPASGGP
jgi:hypothetical protein